MPSQLSFGVRVHVGVGRAVNSYHHVQGRSADAFWPKVAERLQAAPGGVVAARLADAVRSGLEGEGQAEGPAQVASSVLQRIFNRANTR